MRRALPASPAGGRLPAARPARSGWSSSSAPRGRARRFTGKALGSQPGFVDLDEVTPLKAALPRLAGAPPAAAGAGAPDDHPARPARSGSRAGCAASSRRRRRRSRSRPRCSPIRRRRPCTCSATAATSSARCSSAAGCAPTAAAATTRGTRTARTRGSGSSRSGGTSSSMRARRGGPRGPGAATSPLRAAVPERTIELRYEALVASPRGEADRIARRSTPSRRRSGARSARCTARRSAAGAATSPPEQLADVEAEAGALLAELGYI